MSTKEIKILFDVIIKGKFFSKNAPHALVPPCSHARTRTHQSIVKRIMCCGRDSPSSVEYMYDCTATDTSCNVHRYAMSFIHTRISVDNRAHT